MIHLRDEPTRAGRTFFDGLTRPTLLFVVVGLIGSIGVPLSAHAQQERASGTFYLKFGAGLSDFAGDDDGSLSPDSDTPDIADLFDTRKFTEGGPFPYVLVGEIGYRLSPALDIGLGYQFGQYPFASGRPLTVRDDLPGDGGDLGTSRHTIQLLTRYNVRAKEWTFSPYLDTGVSVSFGGYTPSVGPLVGVGLDLALSNRTSLFFEGRVNMTFGDEAMNGIASGTRSFDILSALPSVGLKRTL